LDKIHLLIQACVENRRAGQKKLYQLYLSYGMSVALRYTSNRIEAEEVLNESFFKVFKKINQYDTKYDFKKWFRKIIINTSIDYYRKFKKIDTQELLLDFHEEKEQNDGWDNLLYQDILKHIQKLPPSYRLAFNMYVIEGYKHHEIAEKLNISVGTSKSNYAKARYMLQKHLKTNNAVKSRKHV